MSEKAKDLKFMGTITNGMKYQMLDGDTVKTYRVTGIENSSNTSISKFLSTLRHVLENVDDPKDTISMTEAELNDKCIRIAPDAFINMMIVWLDKDGNDIDVYVCANKASDFMENKTAPSLILRQNIYSQFKNGPMMIGNAIYMGDCYTIFNTDNLQENLEFTYIKDKFSVAFYIGDNQKDILKYTRRKFIKAVQTTLNDISTKLDKATNGMAAGISDSLDGLMTDNGFIENLYGLFNVGSIPFQIDLGKVSYNKDGDLFLNIKQIKALEDYLRRHITNVNVLEYAEDVDISKIVSLDHIMVRDVKNKIYLITYNTIGYYAEGNEDVLNAMISKL